MPTIANSVINGWKESVKIPTAAIAQLDQTSLVKPLDFPPQLLYNSYIVKQQSN